MTDQLHDDLARALEEFLLAQDTPPRFGYYADGALRLNAIQKMREALSRYREAKEGESGRITQQHETQ